MLISLYSPELPDTMAATLEQLAPAPVVEDAAARHEAFLAADDCQACEASGRVESGAFFWSHATGSIEPKLTYCRACGGTGIVAIVPDEIEVEALLAVDAEASAADHLLDAAPVSEAAPVGLLETLLAAVTDAAAALLAGIIHAVADAAELRDRADEHDGMLVHAAGRDVSALVSTDAPVRVLTRPRREHRAAA